VRAEGTQEDIVDICNDSGEESEDEINEMVIETECTVDCCCLTCDKPNQPTEKTVLAKTKKFQGSGKNKQRDACNFVGFKNTDGFHYVQQGINYFVLFVLKQFIAIY